MTRSEALARIRELSREVKVLRRLAYPRHKAVPARLSRKEEQRSLARLRIAEIRADVMERSRGNCEVVGCYLPGGELDHWLGGSGRRRAAQSVENTWLLCAYHHRRRTDNWPTGPFWNGEFRLHCEQYGYPFTPHKEITP